MLRHHSLRSKRTFPEILKAPLRFSVWVERIRSMNTYIQTYIEDISFKYLFLLLPIIIIRVVIEVIVQK